MKTIYNLICVTKTKQGCVCVEVNNKDQQRDEFF